MKFPSKEIVERLRREYPAGSRVVLRKMSDEQAPPIGTRGTIIGIDDAGSLITKWDNGSGLNVVYGEDYAEKLDSVTVVCYGETEVWDSRDEAVNFYLRAMAGSEGSEHERYSNIYTQLIAGNTRCTDE